VAKHIFYNCSLVVNGTDLSDHVEQIDIIAKTDKQAAAAMGEIEDYSMPGTISIDDIQVRFYQDYAASKVYAVLKAAWAARSSFNLVAKPDAGANATTNPAWTIPVFVSSMPVMTGQRGQRHMAPVTFSQSGASSVATS
jgi:hypothetical protein